jgi:hypothetical protein
LLGRRSLPLEPLHQSTASFCFLLKDIDNLILKLIWRGHSEPFVYWGRWGFYKAHMLGLRCRRNRDTYSV